MPPQIEVTCMIGHTDLLFTSLKAPILKVCMQETCGRQMKWVYNCSECGVMEAIAAGYRDRERSAENDPRASLSC